MTRRVVAVSTAGDVRQCGGGSCVQQFVAAEGTIRLRRFGRVIEAPHTLHLMSEGTRGRSFRGYDRPARPSITLGIDGQAQR